MKMYIWESICCLTEEYHNGGGLLVVALDENHAVKIVRGIRASMGHKPPHPMPVGRFQQNNCEELGPPNWEFDVPAETVARVIRFPDSGCC